MNIQFSLPERVAKELTISKYEAAKVIGIDPRTLLDCERHGLINPECKSGRRYRLIHIKDINRAELLEQKRIKTAGSPRIRA